MDQMSRSAQVLLEVGILSGGLEGMRCSLIAVFPDKAVDGGVFAEFLESRSQYYELGIVREGHPGPVNRLVPKPGTLELFRIEIHQALTDLVVHHYEISLQGKLGSLLEALEIISDEESPGFHLAGLFILGTDGKDIYYRKILDEVRATIFQDIADRSLGTAHDPLHSIGSPDEMTLVDALGASDSYEDVLGVVGHADDLVRDHLTYRQDEIERRVQQQPVDLRRPAVAYLALRYLFNIGSRNLSDGDDIVAPIMDPELFLRHAPEHDGNLFVRHRGVSAEGRHHIGQGVTEIVVAHLSDRASVGIQTGEIGRNCKDAPFRAHLVENLSENGPDLFRAYVSGLGTAGEVKHIPTSLPLHFPAIRSRPAPRQPAGRSLSGM